MGWFKNMKITAKLLTGFIMVAMIAAFIGGMGIRSLHEIESGDMQMYTRMTEPTATLMDIAVAFQKMRVHTRDLMLVDSDAARRTQLNDIKERRGDVDKGMKEFEKTVISADTKTLYDAMKSTRDGYFRALDNIAELIGSGRLSEAKAYMDGEGSRKAADFQDALDKMADLKVAKAKAMYESNAATANSATNMMLGLIALGVVLAIGLGLLIARAIVRPVQGLVESAERLAKGDVNVSLSVGGSDEIGVLTQRFSVMANNIRDAALAVERIADGDLKVQLQVRSEQDVLGNGVARLIKTASGLIGETDGLIQATKQGQLDRRGNAAAFSGEWGTLVVGVNQLVDAFVGPINVTAEYVDRISKGDIPPKISDTYHGDFNEIKNNLNNCIDTMTGLLKETGELIQATKQGQLDRRGNAAAFSGEWGTLVGGVNQLVDAFVGPINVTAEYVDRISKGDIPPKISDTYHGDFNEIKNNLNNCIDNLSLLIAEMNRMSKEHDAGDIDVVIDKAKFTGAYQMMADGVNNMVNGHIAVKKKAMACIAEFGRGNFEAPLEPFPGKKAFINETVESVRNNLKALITDTDLLVQAALDGRLNVRAEAAKHGGDFRKIVEGVNHTLDAVIEPVKEAAACLEEMARGNFDTIVKGDYHGDHALIKQALNQSLESINEVLNQVNIAVDQVAAGSRQVSDSSQALSNGATQSASAVEEISSSMHEMAAQTNQNADNANQASQLSTMARDQAEKGNEQMNNMVKAMDDINQAATNISKIIKVIDEIAFQTNLLALNAAVEAARAGKHGKGFTVVAEEVRNLAQRSAKAAKETTEMIEDSIKRTEVGTKIAQDTAESLGEIVRGAVKVTDLISEIAAASREQAQGINQINQALGQVDQVTQQNTASAEESAAASEELSSQAIQLKETVGKFRLRRFERQGVEPANRRWESGGRRYDKPVPPNRNAPVDAPISIQLDDKDFGNF